MVKTLLLAITIACTASIVQARPFIIFSTVSVPFKYLDENQKPAGVHIEIWKHIFSELNIEHEFKFTRSSERVKVEIKKGSADMHFSLSKKKDRLQWYIFPKESYLTYTYNFFIRSEDRDKIKYESFSDFKGLTVGATKTYTYTKDFWASGLKLDESPIDDLLIKKLLAKRIDVMPSKTMNTLYRLKQDGILDKVYVLPKPLTSRRYYNAFSKASAQPDKQKILDNYDRIIQEMKKDGTIEKIFRKYFGDQVSALLN